MRTTIATAEFYATNPEGEQKRLTVAVGTPGLDGNGDGWRCKVAIADVLRPTLVGGSDSFAALVRSALYLRDQLGGMEADGWRFFADPGCERPLDLETWLAPP